MILGDLGQSWAILGDLGGSLAIFGDLGRSWAISGNLGLCSAETAENCCPTASEQLLSLQYAYYSRVTRVHLVYHCSQFITHFVELAGISYLEFSYNCVLSVHQLLLFSVTNRATLSSI